MFQNRKKFLMFTTKKLKYIKKYKKNSLRLPQII